MLVDVGIVSVNSNVIRIVLADIVISIPFQIPVNLHVVPEVHFMISTTSQIEDLVVEHVIELLILSGESAIHVSRELG